MVEAMVEVKDSSITHLQRKPTFRSAAQGREAGGKVAGKLPSFLDINPTDKGLVAQGKAKSGANEGVSYSSLYCEKRDLPRRRLLHQMGPGVSSVKRVRAEDRADTA